MVNIFLLHHYLCTSKAQFARVILRNLFDKYIAYCVCNYIQSRKKLP